MSEFDKLPLAIIECEYNNCDYFFYYWSDYVAHKDLKHPGNKIAKPNTQRRLFES